MKVSEGRNADVEVAVLVNCQNGTWYQLVWVGYTSYTSNPNESGYKVKQFWNLNWSSHFAIQELRGLIPMAPMEVLSPLLPSSSRFTSPSRGVAMKTRSTATRSSKAPLPKSKAVTTPSVGHKRKSASTPSTQPNSGTTTPSSNKKRTRLSIGTPGKVTPLTGVREKDVQRKFTELEVSDVYKAIRKQTGSLGGNAAGGAIYGEITQSSFQRVVDYLKENCELTSASRFLDVGSGLGKPNFHVSVDPGVQVSYGIELEELRWHLSLHNLRSVLSLDSQRDKHLATVFTAGDITDAHTLNPFSHIYSFDVGFPPDVMDKMAEMFNRSTAKYFASFHTPRKVVDTYGFSVENIGRVATSMAGSSEGHQCYFYRRVAPTDEEDSESESVEVPVTMSPPEGGEGASLSVDPLFRQGFELLKTGREGMLEWIADFFGQEVYAGRTRRQKRELRQRPIQTYYPVVGKAQSVAGTKDLTEKSKSKRKPKTKASRKLLEA